MAITHLIFLTSVAGWHLDEAWAANFAHRIAYEKGFWPFQAMSPYTAAWSHYLAAGSFRVFGTSVFVYRANGIAEVLLGTLLVTLALIKSGRPKAASLFPWVVAFFPALVMNQRWVIEMNTFFVLCAGLIAYGLATRRTTFVYVGAFFGITSHVLFLAPCLALLYWCWVQGKLTQPKKTAIFSLFLGIFFLRIFFKTEADDHVKAFGLVILSAVIALGAFIPEPKEKLKKYLLGIPAAIALPLLIPFCIFAEGSWVALFSVGFLQTPYLVGSLFIPVALLIYWERKVFTAEILWLPLCLVTTLAMVVKPGPRYYEIPFLFCAAMIAIGLSQINVKHARAILALWIGLNSAQLGINYFKPALAEEQIDTTFHLGRFHDSSSDMLPTQRLARRLSREGCDYSDLSLSDVRLDECLKFLSYGDWPAPMPHQCKLGRRLDILRTPGNEGQFTIKQPSDHE